MKIRLLRDYVLLELPKHDDEVRKSGIIVPKTTSDGEKIGIVTNIGPNVSMVKINDKVTFIHLDAIGIKDEGKEYVILVEDDILAVLED